MNDADRVRLAKRGGKRGSRMLGPDERQRCARHPKRWEIYRWTWTVGGSIENGEPDIVRGCAECIAEDES